jgi:hypothetical protein
VPPYEVLLYVIYFKTSHFDRSIVVPVSLELNIREMLNDQSWFKH